MSGIKKVIILVFISGIVLLAGCSAKKPDQTGENTGTAQNEQTGQAGTKAEGSSSGSKYDTRDLVAEQSDKLIQAIMKKDALILSAAVHPINGIRISPYGYVDPQTDPVFDMKHIKAIFSSTDKIDWGIIDETGKAELLTPAEYFDEYLVSKYASPGSRATEDMLDGSNITELYRDSIVIQHMCGQQRDGAYDNIILMVYENYEDKWYLSGIVPVMIDN